MRALALVCLAGCSFFVRGAPDEVVPGQPVDCTSDVTAPVIDALVAIPATVIGIDALRTPTSDRMNALVLVPAAVFGAAMIYGAVKIAGCKDAKRRAGQR